MGLYDDYRRPLGPGDLVMHYDTGHIGFIVDASSDVDTVSVFILNKVRQMFRGSFSRIKNGS